MSRSYAVRALRRLTAPDHAGRRRTRDERGAIAVMTGLLAVALIVAAAFSVDIGNALAVRGMLQKQVDEAAIFAAAALPVALSGPNAAASKTAVAKRVTYYVVCGPVRGQAQADPLMPTPTSDGGSVRCDGDTTQTALDAYAGNLLSTGMVTFPTSTSVAVTGPAAKVDFGFGPVADAEGVGEQKSATAKIYSPGSAAPIALGLQCTLTAAGAAPLGLGNLATGAIPLNYISAGPLGADTTAEPAEAVTLDAMPDGASAVLAPMPTGMLPTSQTQGYPALLTAHLLNLPGTTVTVSGPLEFITTTTTSAAGSGVVRLNFFRGTTQKTSNELPYVSVLNAATVVGFTVPPDVSKTPGVWFVQAEYKPTGADTFVSTTKASHQRYTVLLPAGVESLTACANLMDSPRQDTNNAIVADETMRRNIKAGMDHSLVAHGSLATLNPPSAPVTTGSVLGTLSNSPSITDCTASPGSVLDTDALRLDPLANCVNIATDGARQAEFTQGFLADPDGSFRGRLSCEVASCNRGTPFAIAGLPGTYNDDKITDFVNPGSILNSPLFFGLSTYLTDDVPAVTPPSTALDPDLYSSPRFFWAAVGSRSVGPTACTECPVLTFRPVFLTQDAPSDLALTADDLLHLQIELRAGINAASILSSLFPFLGPAASSNDHGILMNGSQLRALRFQTIEPTALPVPPLDYDGAVSDYLGVGPKIVRLVR